MSANACSMCYTVTYVHTKLYHYYYTHTIEDQPDVVSNLQLVPSKGDLILSWKRPGNVPEAVPINYTVIINNTDASSTSMNITNGTSFSLRTLEDQVQNNNSPGMCVMFEFSVSGSNDAGSGQPNAVIDTIPICKLARYIPHSQKILVGIKFGGWIPDRNCKSIGRFKFGSSVWD